MTHEEEIKCVKELLNKNPNDSFNIMQDNIPKYTMYGYLERSNECNKKNYALRFGHKRITYDEFLKLIDRYSKGFLSMGIRPGDRVALLLPNLPESTIIIYALNKIGAVSSNIDPTAKPEIIKYFFEKEKINSIVCFDQLYDNTLKPIENYIFETLKIDKILLPSISDSLIPIEKFLFNFKQNKFLKKDRVINCSYGKVELLSIPNFIKNSKYQLNYTNPYVPNQIATVCHSSGTEGIPKSIPSTNENVNFIAFQHEVSGIDYSKVKTFLHILPGFAQFGFSDSMHLGHILGLEMIEVPIFSHEMIIDVLIKTRANCIFSDPSLWMRLACDPKYANIDLSFLQEAVYGGGKLTPKQVEKVNKFLVSHGARCLLRVGYGLSEFNGTCILEDPFLSTPGSCGRDLIGGSGLILNSNTLEPVKDGEYGNLYYSKASMPVCEFDGKILHTPIEINGRKYIDTGDIMTCKDGEYFFATRSSGMISRYDGFKIFPNVIENKLTSTLYIEDCMATEYYEEEKYGMMPIAYIVPSKNFDIQKVKEIISYIIDTCFLDDENFSHRYIPTKWKIVDSLPITSAQKKDYKTLMHRQLDGSEITVKCKETNMGIESYEIIIPEKQKKLEKIKE